MHLPGRNGHRPDGTVLVAADLAHGRHKPPPADAVATHDGVLQHTVLIKILHIHALGVLGAELEDVAHLDTAFDSDGVLAAHRANAALGRFCHTHVFHIADVARKIQPFVVVVFLVCTVNQRADAAKRLVIYHRHVFRQVFGADKAGVKPHFLGHGRRVNLAAHHVAQFGLVDFQVAADKDNHQCVVRVFLIQHRLAGCFCRRVQEVADFLDRFLMRGLHQLQRLRRGLLVLHNAVGNFHIGAVTALRAEHDGVLSDVGQQHKLMRNSAAHHSGVGFHRHHFRHAATGENALIGVIADVIIPFQVFLRGVEGVSVFHREFAGTDQPPA